jgi:hypothetical protein
VFNALEGLFDLERDAPPGWHPAVEYETLNAGADSGEITPARKDLSTHSGTSGDADSGEHHGAESLLSISEPPGRVAPEDSVCERANLEQTLPPMSLPTPNFLLDEKRTSGLHGSLSRLLLSVSALLLLVALGVQGVHHFRDQAFARWPSLQPALTGWCRVMDCSIEAARRIEDIGMESTALTRSVGADSFRLAVALRNRGKWALALPSLDLSLTDSSGKLLARRALDPRDFREASAILMPGLEATLQLNLATGSLGITGYTVEIFYP